MNILIVNGTDINKPASGSGVVIRQFLNHLPKNHNVIFLNLGTKCSIPYVKTYNIKIKRKSYFIEKIITLFTNTSIMYSRYLSDHKVKEKVIKLVEDYDIDVVYYHDTIAMMHFVNLPNVSQQAHLIDLHSKSYEYYIKSSANLLKQFVYKREKYVCEKYERLISNTFDRLYLVNKSEADYANMKYNTNRYFGINLGTNLSTEVMDNFYGLDKIKFIYLGNLKYKANVDGLNHFINNYFLKLANLHAYELHIVGPGSKQFDVDNNNIITHGFVDDLGELMGKMHFGIATMINGSGMKNKIFDYLRYGVPVLANRYTINNNNVDSQYIIEINNKEQLLEVCDGFDFEVSRKDIKNSIINYDEKFTSEFFWNQIGIFNQ